MPTVEFENKRLYVSGVGRGYKTKLNHLGGYYSEKHDTWSFPAVMRVCRELRKIFGSRLTIGPVCMSWAKREVARERLLETVRLGSNEKLTRCPPLLDDATKTRQYQRVAASWGRHAHNFLLADQQGLGKTIETLATIMESSPDDDRTQWHIVFAPAVAVTGVWAREAERWLGELAIKVVPLTGSLIKRNETLKNLTVPEFCDHVFVISTIESARIKPSYGPKDKAHKYPHFKATDALLPALHERIWDTIVVDECQRALIRTTGKKSQTRGGFELLSANSNRRIALSGTPMRGKPEQLWGTLNWLYPDKYSAFWPWADRYFSRESDGHSDFNITGFQPGGEDRLAEDLKTIMLRRTKAEVLKELPPKMYGGSLLDPSDPKSPLGVWLEPLPEQRRQIEELEDQDMITGIDEELLVNGTLAVYTRQKQLATAVHQVADGKLYPTAVSSKLNWLGDFLDHLDGQKVVIASQFTSIIDCWASVLQEWGYSVGKITGKTTQKARDRIKDKFQETDELQVLMLNTKAGGVALTLDAADYLVMIDETTIPDDQEQVEDRIHRTSRIHNVTIYHLKTLGTIDEEIAWVAAAREDIAKYLMDGARGIEYAKQIYREAHNGNT